MDFTSLYSHGFARVAAVTAPIRPADPAYNVASVLQEARACHDEGVAVAIFPELCLSGYAIEDLVLQDSLLESVRGALASLPDASARLFRGNILFTEINHGYINPEAERYADRSESDHAALAEAVRSGRVEATTGL